MSTHARRGEVVYNGLLKSILFRIWDGTILLIDKFELTLLLLIENCSSASDLPNYLAESVKLEVKGLQN
jgi:hypothetical protein